jgi:hypothetical protein
MELGSTSHRQLTTCAGNCGIIIRASEENYITTARLKFLEDRAYWRIQSIERARIQPCYNAI